LVEVAARRLKIILLARARPFRFAGAIRMKLVVFAQTPPPLHGQSYMVELLVEGFRARDYGIEVFHVNAQFATTAAEIGKFSVRKVLRLFGYCATAVWLRFRHGAANLYYIPAPPVKVPLYRDWVILILLRPFFRNFIQHWEASGLGEWVAQQPGVMKRITQVAHGRSALSITLSSFGEKDAALFRPRQSVTVPNGVPDPCPDFPRLLMDRRERLRTRQAAWEPIPAAVHPHPVPVRVLFLSLCSREKGLFDALEGVCQANRICRDGRLPVRFELTIAGSFPDAATEEFFKQTLERLGSPNTIQYIGFADANAKARLMAQADIFCFPTYYYAESFGIVVVEAMAFGLPIVATRWRSVPDFFPSNYPGLVDIQSPDQIASALLDIAVRDDAEDFRARFLQKYTVQNYVEGMAAAIKSIDPSPAVTYTQPAEFPTSAPPPAP
jgi:glycosyltransferase involved in cell wall biosynthesis